MSENISLIIKTFERQNALERLLDSIAEQGYADCPVLVADDSRDPYRDAILEEYGDLVDEYIVLPFDSGLSKGRNTLLDQVQTEYFVLNDDDFVYDTRTDLPWMHACLQEHEIDLLGGVVYEKNEWNPRSILKQFPGGVFGAIRRELKTLYQSTVRQKKEKTVRFHGMIRVNDRTVSLERIECAPPFTRCDYTLNFFMANTGAVREKVGGWNEDLKVSEHWEFFYRAKRERLRVATTEEVGVLHRPIHRNAYVKQRFSREAQCRRIGLEAHGLEQLILQGYKAHDISGSASSQLSKS